MSSEPSGTPESEPERQEESKQDSKHDPPVDQEALTRQKIGKAVFNFYDSVNGSVGISGAAASPPRRITGVLNADEIDESLQYFVAPTCFDVALADLGEQHVVGLHGQPGSGRETTAIALLRTFTSGSVVVLSPMVTLKELAGRTYDQHRAYLVADRIAEPSAADTEFLWREVKQRVKAADAYLVLTVAADASTETNIGLPTIPLTRPGLEDVVESYLADTVEPDLLTVAATVPDDWRMATLARLLRRLRRGGDLATAAHEFDTAAITTVGEWIKTAGRSELLTVVAACFLSGCNERFLESQRARLEARIVERFPSPETVERGPTESDSLLTARSSRTARGMLLQVSRIVDRERSRKGVMFRDPSYRRIVLKTLWEGYESPFWDAVAEWIDEILPECDLTEIAIGLALLADADFEEVEDNYLDPWASGRSSYRGQFQAALVVWSMCFDVSDNERLGRDALRKSIEWSKSPDRVQRETAVVALSGAVGLLFPPDATRRLWHLSVNGGPTRDTARIGLVTLFASLIDNSEDSGFTILALLDRQLRSLPRLTSESSQHLVECTMQTVLELLSVRMDGRDTLAVLEYLRRHPHRIDVVARIWVAVIRRSRYRRRALEALWRALCDLSTMHEADPRAEARALGAALRSAIPDDEHPQFKTDLKTVDRMLRGSASRELVEILLEVLCTSDGNPAGGE